MIGVGEFLRQGGGHFHPAKTTRQISQHICCCSLCRSRPGTITYRSLSPLPPRIVSCRMANAMKADVAFDPVDISLLRSIRKVLGAGPMSNLVQ
jgi:hypothetical protein